MESVEISAYLASFVKLKASETLIETGKMA